MGTRADFYVGRGKDAEWLGSIAWDGYPDGLEKQLLDATTPEEFRMHVSSMLADRDDATLPEHGWPWPWENSQTTDYAYAFDEGKVLASCFGGRWYVPKERKDEDEEEDDNGPKVDFPDMSKRRQMAEPGSRRSGVMVFTAK